MIAWECQFDGQGNCSHAKCDGIMRFGGGYERPCGCPCHAEAIARVRQRFQQMFSERYPDHPWVKIWEREASE